MPIFHGNTIGQGVVLNTPSADGTAGQLITTDGSGNLSFGTAIITPEQFGAVGDGVADDYAAVQSAMQTGECNLTAGKSYKIATAFTVTGDVKIIGNGATIICATATATPILITGNTVITDVIFSASGESGPARLIQLAGDGTSHRVTGCEFRDLLSATTAVGLTFADNEFADIYISESLFSNIRATANSVIGDTNGSCRGVFFGCGAESITVNNCIFDDINSVTAGTPVGEDADAVQTLPSTGGDVIKNFNSIGCFFNNVGKRAYKLSDCERISIRDSEATSSWSGGTIGMQSFVAAYSGKIVLDNCEINGGLSERFCNITSTNEGSSLINCRYNPTTYNATVGSEEGQVLIAPVGFTVGAGDVFLLNCSAINCGTAVSTAGTTPSYAIADCNFVSYSNCIIINSITDRLTISGCLLKQDAGSVETTRAAVQIYDSVLTTICTGNRLEGFRDGFWMETRSSNENGDFHFWFLDNDATLTGTNTQIRDQSAGSPANINNIVKKDNVWNSGDGVRIAVADGAVLALTHANRVVVYSSGSAGSITIPEDATVPFVIGTEIEIHQGGAGALTISPAVGVTLQSRGGLYNTAGQYAVTRIRKTLINTWVLSGSTA